MQVLSGKSRPGAPSAIELSHVIDLPATAGDCSAIILWLRLWRYVEAQGFDSHDQLASQCGWPVKTWRRLLSRIERMGLVRLDGKSITLLLPYEQPVSEPIPEHVFASVISEQQTCAISDNQAIIDAWNQYKPINYWSIDSSISPDCILAYKTQINRLKHDVNDDDGFIKIICAALKANDFWNSKSLKFYSVFGFGIPIDKKLKNVEQLYRDGKNLIKIDLPVVELAYDSQSILDRFNMWQNENYSGLPEKTNTCVISPPVEYDSAIDDLFSTIRRYIALQAKTCVGMGQLDMKEIISIEQFLVRNKLYPADYMFYYSDEHGWPTETRPATLNRIDTLDNDLWIFYEDAEQVFKSKPNLISDVW